MLASPGIPHTEYQNYRNPYKQCRHCEGPCWVLGGSESKWSTHALLGHPHKMAAPGKEAEEAERKKPVFSLPEDVPEEQVY